MMAPQYESASAGWCVNVGNYNHETGVLTEVFCWPVAMWRVLRTELPDGTELASLRGMTANEESDAILENLGDAHVCPDWALKEGEPQTCDEAARLVGTKSCEWIARRHRNGGIQ